MAVDNGMVFVYVKIYLIGVPNFGLQIIGSLGGGVLCLAVFGCDGVWCSLGSYINVLGGGWFCACSCIGNLLPGTHCTLTLPNLAVAWCKKNNGSCGEHCHTQNRCRQQDICGR